MRLRVREIIAQVAEEMNIRIVNGVLSAEHVHIFSDIPPHISVSNFVKIAKGRSSRKIQQKFPHIGKEYWGKGFFSNTSGNVTDDMINKYINNHSDAHRSDNYNNISLE